MNDGAISKSISILFPQTRITGEKSSPGLNTFVPQDDKELSPKAAVTCHLTSGRNGRAGVAKTESAMCLAAHFGSCNSFLRPDGAQDGVIQESSSWRLQPKTGLSDDPLQPWWRLGLDCPIPICSPYPIFATFCLPLKVMLVTVCPMYAMLLLAYC